MNQLEMWGGLECTVNRVGDRYFDQLERNGHCARVDDLDLFEGVGFQAIRYPLLWERIAPRGLSSADWAWADARMERLRNSRMRPIVGLVHHGSGPRHTSLLEDSFATGLADFAGTVAARYPWVTDFTPVNEPLTTARFSGLYGLWYPHHRDFGSFVRALLVQCRAVALSMRAIRAVNPAARLIQTEDFGRTYSTPALAYQAAYENERRWLSLDLLCGRMTPAHPWWVRLLEGGASEAELEWFLEEPPPDLIGVNYYLTSDRLLDERTGLYPEACVGGNGRHRYADTEAVRGWAGGILGHAEILRQVERRYGIPVAITEVQAGATREEQLRWLNEAWTAATTVRAEGVDVRAVTAWSLLGTWDWHAQVTRDDGLYETGVFDTRGGRPRPTAVARMAADLSRVGRHHHPVLSDPGWWRRPERFAYSPVGPEGVAVPTPGAPLPGAPILITGASGTLGRAIGEACRARGLAHRLLTRRELDVADAASVSAALQRYRPWAVVNASGYVRVDDAETDAERCHRENAVGPAVLADECRVRGVQLLTFSSDLVFDGAKRAPYVESAPPRPLGVYGATKAEAEAEVARRYPEALTIRTSAFFSPGGRHDFLAAAMRALREGECFPAAEDVFVSPTYVPDLAHASLDLLIDAEWGIWHLANAAEISWAEFARRAADLTGQDSSLVRGRPLSELGLPAPRPAYSVLDSERGRLLPALDDALARWAREWLREAPADLGAHWACARQPFDNLICQGGPSCTTI
jgi:dTDP-4-dehydrorhamnose reductase